MDFSQDTLLTPLISFLSHYSEYGMGKRIWWRFMEAVCALERLYHQFLGPSAPRARRQFRSLRHREVPPYPRFGGIDLTQLFFFLPDVPKYISTRSVDRYVTRTSSSVFDPI
ncbi:hypothetical protein M413DRAFT_152459 [Hebeloma cylindrosporum]|uniref:Uncharacterized protein n=1 Tax=Hebeloma cylindrosporum TaxID=76867 RepID=A0A0C3CBN7_HEBCY|nr:hypothetical protein M413DRAFT_152459 [Hebeloma cylindrosporum h7]